MAKVRLKHEVVPLDLAILGILENEGALDGYDVDGTTVAELVDILSEKAGKPVPAAKIQARLRTMKLKGQELVVDAPGGAKGKRLWQRTGKGQQLVSERGVPTPGKG